MNERQPTRAALLEMGDERRALRDGHVFLDEKCLLLAGEMMRQLGRHAVLERELHRGHDQALAALRDALARHGLDGLQVQRPLAGNDATFELQHSSLMGVALREANWAAASGSDDRGKAEPVSTFAIVAEPSAEVHACAQAFAALLPTTLALAATSGNLERLSQEYRHTLRRARALQDVLLPELDREIAFVEGALDEAERQDAMAMRGARRE